MSIFESDSILTTLLSRPMPGQDARSPTLQVERIVSKGRVALRQERNREALVQAGYSVMSEKGIDAATMQEIAERADVGAGTVTSRISVSLGPPWNTLGIIVPDNKTIEWSAGTKWLKQ